MSSPQILLTGATGYIGGTILTNLLNSSSPSLKGATITCLIRGQDRADKLTSTYGDRVRIVLYKDLDDLETTTATAAEHDVVINTTLGFHPPSGQALVRGLAKRKESTGKDVWIIHTSGTSNLSDQSISGKFVSTPPNRVFDDVKDDVYGYEKEREVQSPYGQRTSELGVVDLGLELGVKTVVLLCPMAFGLGTGLFNKLSVQIPTYIRSAIQHGHASVVGEGKTGLDAVHVEDLAELYKVLLVNVLEKDGKDLPTGKKGLIFGGGGWHTWGEVAQEVADACYGEGKIKEKKAKSVGLPDGATLLQWGGVVAEDFAEIAMSTNSRSVASVAKGLGWKPAKGEEAWKQGFRDDVKVIAAESS